MEDGLCSLEVQRCGRSEMLKVLEMPEMIRYALLYMLEAVELWRSGGAGGVGGDTLCATLYAGGCGG